MQFKKKKTRPEIWKKKKKEGESQPFKRGRFDSHLALFCCRTMKRFPHVLLKGDLTAREDGVCLSLDLMCHTSRLICLWTRETENLHLIDDLTSNETSSWGSWPFYTFTNQNLCVRNTEWKCFFFFSRFPQSEFKSILEQNSSKKKPKKPKQHPVKTPALEGRRRTCETAWHHFDQKRQLFESA